MPSRRPQHPLGRCILLALLTAGCGDADAFAAAREVLPDGTVLVSYGDPSAAPADTLSFDLVIGRVDGEPWETYGRINGLAVDGDGSIYVLDSQTFAIHILDRQGDHRGTVGRRGDGPGEFRRPTGLLVAPDGTLWVRDQLARRLVVLSQDGRELAIHPLPAEGSGSSDWDALIDGHGRIWQSWTHQEGATPLGSSEPALLEWTRRHQVRSFDPRSGASDSLMIGESTVRMLFAVPRPGSFALGYVPFDPQTLIALDREATAWTGSSGEYRITRRGLDRDSTLIIQVAVEGPLPSDEQRSDAQSTLDRVGLDLDLPERRPPLVRLLTDDLGRLWVQRAVGPGEPAHLDAFARDGRWLGSVRIAADLAASPAPVIRGGHLYAVILGELDVPQIARAPLPAFAR